MSRGKMVTGAVLLTALIVAGLALLWRDTPPHRSPGDSRLPIPANAPELSPGAMGPQRESQTAEHADEEWDVDAAADGSALRTGTGDEANPWDPGVPTRWLTPEVTGDPGAAQLHLGLLHHPERPAQGDDAAEPAQDELVLYALLSPGREVKCRIRIFFDAGDGQGLRWISGTSVDFTESDPSLPRLTRAGLFFDAGDTVQRGETYEALITTWDAAGDLVREVRLRRRLP